MNKVHNDFKNMSDEGLRTIIEQTGDDLLANALQDLLDKRIAARTAAALRDHRAAYARSLARRMKGC